jgi:hypothetical protein
MLNRLYDELLMVEEVSEHEGYLYSASDTLLLLILGMLCGLPHIDDIHDRAKSKPTGVFLSKRFGIENIPCRAQIYNILKSISVCLRSKHTEMLVMTHCIHPFYSCSRKHYYIGFLALSHFLFCLGVALGLYIQVL